MWYLIRSNLHHRHISSYENIERFLFLCIAFLSNLFLFAQPSFSFSAHSSLAVQTFSRLKLIVAELNWNWNSIPTFGHTFKKHGQGSSNTNSLKGTAAGTKTPQGQWLDNETAATFLKNLRPTISGNVTTIIPKGLGQVINPDGTIMPATHAVVILSPTTGGYRTSFPFVPGKPDYNADSEPVN